jgi:hypothetical protein
MSSVLLPAAVTLLAQKRLMDIADGLDNKLDLTQFARNTLPPGNVSKRAVERRVLTLAREAVRLLGGGPKVQMPPGLVLGQGSTPQGDRRIGKYALMGSAAYSFPEYLDCLTRNQGWIANVLRRGSPDPQLSRVLVGSTQLPFVVARKALGKTTDAGEQERIRAFVMGMLCAAAADVIATPLLRGLQARRNNREWNRHLPAEGVHAVDERIARDLLGNITRSEEWQRFWPQPNEVPDALFEGFAEAAEEVYRIGADRPKGFGLFEEDFGAGSALSARRLRHAYNLFLNGEITLGQGFGVGGWWLFLNVFWWPPLLAMLTSLAPPGKELFEEDGRPDEKSWFAVANSGLFWGSITPFVLSMMLWSRLPDDPGPFVEALVFFIARLILTVVGFAGFGADWSREARWFGITTPLAAIDLYVAIRAIIAAARGERGPSLVFGMQTLPLITALVSLGMAGLVRAIGPGKGTFWAVWGVTAGLLLLIGLPIAIALNRAGGISAFLRRQGDDLPVIQSLRGAAGGADLRAMVRLFDDSTLWLPPGTADPTLAHLRYPSGPRALVRLWWEGDGELEIAHDNHKVVFVGPAGRQEILLPPAPITSEQLAARLHDTVQDGAGATGRLMVEALDPAEQRYPLPYPCLFQDPGDQRATHALHDAHHNDFVPVGSGRSDAYLLRHAPRAEYATAMGARGTSGIELEGIAVVPEPSLADLQGSAVGLAGDLAALFSLGAAPTLHDGPLNVPGVGANPQLREVYQVFRQWNLDERRVNEWRMLVLGGAVSEKKGTPRARDEALRPHPTGAAYNSPFSTDPLAAEAESLGRDMGWIPLWRAWSRMATDVTSDTTDNNPMDYTPAVRRGAGPAVRPTNSQLSDALRYLLELV